MNHGGDDWRIRAEINHAALHHNAIILRAALGKDLEILAVVKANGYGHGGPSVARTLAPLVEQFGVATYEEALEIKQAAPDHDILVLSPCLPEERRAVVQAGFIPVVSSTEEAMAYANLAHTSTVPIHLCIDTGMGRIGIWQDEALSKARSIAALPRIVVESVSTHLPVADTDSDFTEAELEFWMALVDQLRPILPQAKFHALNSAASLRQPQYGADRIRPGLALYGISPWSEFPYQLQPAMTLKTRITLVRQVGIGRGVSYGRDFITDQPMRIATLAMGYADGYPRQSSNRGAEVLIRGQRCPVLARITMDQFMVDVTHLPANLEPGEEVVLFGRQNQAEISVHEVAAWSGTITWDILTRLGRRVEVVHQLA